MVKIMNIFFRLQIIYILLCVYACIHAHNNNWTWLYTEKYTHNKKNINNRKRQVLFKKENIAPFTQLLLSWNVIRPEKGYFSFYIQVRNAQTKEWGDWYLMANWGSGIQKTYLTKSDGLASCVHVRLEVDQAKAADAFCIKIEPHDGAQLSLLDAIAVAASDFGLFTAQEAGLGDLKTVIVTNVPAIAQFALDHTEKGRICSPVSCAMLVEYVTGQKVKYDEFIAAIFDEGLGVYGSWQCNVAHMFDVCKGKMNFFVRRAQSFADVHESLIKRCPVIVSVRGDLPGAMKPFPHGHLLVIIGWDNETREVICHDPAAESNEMVLKRYPVEPFLRAWERSYRLMYIIN